MNYEAENYGGAGNFGKYELGNLSLALGSVFNNLKGTTAQNWFSAMEAAKNRDWQQYMSNTSYQRAVTDMKAAGINPATLGNGVMDGASTPSGSAAASTSTTGSSPLGLIARAAIAAITKGLTAKMSNSAMKAATAGSQKKVIEAVAKDAKTESLSAKYAAARDAEVSRILARNKQIEDDLIQRAPLGRYWEPSDSLL